MDLNVMAEEYGGEVMCAEISGKTGDGVDHLLEGVSVSIQSFVLLHYLSDTSLGVLLQTDVLELTAPAEGLAEATVLDSRL